MVDEDKEYEPIFKRAVVAAAFSPRLIAVLNEAHRILKILGTWPIIVHVGEDTVANRTKLEEGIERSNFKDHPPIHLIRTGHPADVLIEVAKEYHADLIVAGAMKKEGLFKYYLGSVARNLARHAPCSVLLFTDPQINPKPIEKIHCAVEYDDESRLAVEVAANIAYYAGTRDLYLTHSFRMQQWEDRKKFPEDTEEIKKVYKEEEEKLRKFLGQFNFWNLQYHIQCLYENSRSSTLKFTREMGADLFIVTGPRNRLGLWDRLFPHDLELALMDLPCSLLLVRKSQT